MTLRWPLFLLLSGILLTLVGGEPQNLPKDMPFSDENTGMVFPAKLGAYRKSEIRISENPAVGLRIQYAGSRIGCAATIYVYALTEKPAVISPEQFRQHYRHVRRSILHLDRLTRKVEEVESVRRERGADPENNPVLREQFHIRTAGEELYHSELLLILCGDRIIKVRITVPASEKTSVAECGQFVVRFCRLFFRNQSVVFEPYDPDKNDVQPKS